MYTGLYGLYKFWTCCCCCCCINTSALPLQANYLNNLFDPCREETFKTTELIPKLEPAFLAGLRCNQPHIRAKFFEIFDQSIRRRLHDRLMYIVSSQNWEPMGQHYWIKQCIELILVTADESEHFKNEISFIRFKNFICHLRSIQETCVF